MFYVSGAIYDCLIMPLSKTVLEQSEFHRFRIVSHSECRRIHCKIHSLHPIRQGVFDRILHFVMSSVEDDPRHKSCNKSSISYYQSQHSCQVTSQTWLLWQRSKIEASSPTSLYEEENTLGHCNGQVGGLKTVIKNLI